ncbi:cache domain-containing protein [Massilia sp. GCM10023247]|uniref:cache domain-containing protein n=1 Tax=Massilia sp. GCM10023247 TaxID=3252643 RepID=UPI00360C3B27
MKRVLTAALFGLSMASAVASEPTAKDAIAMVERGAAFAKANGKEALLQKITAKDPDFVQGSMYIYVRDFPVGVNIAHPYNQSIVGKDLNDVPDVNGKMYRREIMEMAKKDGKGWVDYMYKNPDNGKIEAKTSYLMRVNDIVLIAGIYKK